MTLAELLAQLLAALLKPQQLQPANTTKLTKALTDLQGLTPKKKETGKMTAPVPNVQIAQADLDNFAAEFEAVKTALAAYIAMLVANQGTPLAEADEAGLTQALADLTALEPPAPTP